MGQRKEKENKQAQEPPDAGGSPRTEFYVFSGVIHQQLPTLSGPVVTQIQEVTGFSNEGSRLVVAQNKPLYDPVIPLLQYACRKLKAGTQTDTSTHALTAS